MTTVDRRDLQVIRIDRLGLTGRTLVVGLGTTGLSCARFLHGLGLPVAVTDSRAEAPQLEAARSGLPDVELFTGGFAEEALTRCDQLVVSPGVSLRDPYLQRAQRLGLTVMGDIELFARCADAPVVAVTGSNGKSTVTALVGEMARRAGREARVGGNIGTPALELLGDTAPDLYVLELSSFQLEATWSLNARAAALLNVSPDHLDRYRDAGEYLEAKLRVFRGDGTVVLNRDDPALRDHVPAGRKVVTFGADTPGEGHFGLGRRDGETWLMQGGEALLASRELRMSGAHNVLNALAALALGAAADLPRTAMTAELRSFGGLPHRMQYVGSRGGVDWYNDSKGTNVGATLAAVTGLGGATVLIAGGLAKGQDFSALIPVLAERARTVILIGRDAPAIAAALGDAVPVRHAADMAEAVRLAAAAARPGDSVLLSPACASFDMYSGFEERGRCFIQAFEELSR